MPIHDWTSVPAGVYHDFLQGWTIEISRALNRSVLPPEFVAMVELPAVGLERVYVPTRSHGHATQGGRFVEETPPRLRQVGRCESEAARYAMKANRIAIRLDLERVVAMIEVVSPGNKDGRYAVGSFIDRAADFIRNGIHLLMVDPFPPGPRAPEGLARAIWDQLSDEPFEARPADKPLTVAAIDAGEPLTVYVESLAVGDLWPDAPLFLAPGWYVDIPLEQTYMASWEVTPRPLRELLVPQAGRG